MQVLSRRTVLAWLCALVLLLLAAPRPAAAVARLRAASTAVDAVEPLVAAVALTAWGLALWLVVASAVVVAARTPGAFGRGAAVLARRIAPAAVRRALEIALGVTVTVAGTAVPAAAAGAAAPATSAAPTASAAPVLPSLDWPALSGPAVTASAAPDTAPTAPAPGPGAATPEAEAPRADAPRAPAAQTRPPQPPIPTTPAAPAPPPPVRAPSVSQPPDEPESRGSARPSPGMRSGDASVAAPAASAVVVAPGDSLWELAEAHLERTRGTAPTPRQVASAWPQWWTANREVVGDDPDLILPGTVLQPPGP